MDIKRCKSDRYLVQIPLTTVHSKWMEGKKKIKEKGERRMIERLGKKRMKE